MSEEERTDPLDPAIGALFEAERTGSGPPPGSKARVLSRVLMSIPVTPAVPTPPSPSPSPVRLATSWPRLFGALVTGAVLGGGAVAVFREPRVVYVDRPVSTPVAPPSAPVSVMVPEVVVPPLPSSRVAVPVPSVAPVENTLGRERAILDEARDALRREDSAAALEASRRHEREFPRGQLAEERDAIAIQALVKLHRNGEAKALGQRFRAQHPKSVLMPVIDAALAQIGGK